MATRRAPTDYWGRLVSQAPNDAAVAHMVQALYDGWPTLTRSIVHRAYYLEHPTLSRACLHCAATFECHTQTQRYCTPRCKKQAELERAQLRKTAGIARR
jgi:hypothetical protein